jgi:hypothetical protein
VNPLSPSEDQRTATAGTLSTWQSRLEDHFSRLHKQRHAIFPKQPVFALEHGLTDQELSNLSKLVIQARPSDRHWLAWVVYATEVGYEYAGDEYWQTFEEKTPRWLMWGDRYWLRDCFWKFSKTYNGAKPSGAWARHFSIICWPITHAILPQDLQRQLAEILYQIRHSFRRELFESPELLGNQIAARSWMATPRFQMLTKEPLLLGQIAAALLIAENDPAKSLIAPDTLLRIAKNLNRERGSREWLKDARSAAKARLTGVAPATSRAIETQSSTPREQLQALGIEPRVYLQATQSSAWKVILQIPDLAPLLSRFPSLTEALNGTCVVAGSTGRPLSRGRLLHYGPQTVVLKRWPSPTEILLKFEKPPLELEFLLKTECMLRPGPAWLFKISADPRAREIRTQIVRPGNKYILLRTEKASSEPQLPIVPLECEGISAVSIDVPAVLSDKQLHQFIGLGLQPAQQVDVRPAGLPPVDWDGDGAAEWLSSDRPCVCISSDHLVRALTLNLEGSAPSRLDIVPKESGERIFVEFEELPLGDHTLHVLVKSSNDRILTGRLDIAIRDPRPWRAVLTDQNAFTVVSDQPDPSLEQVWEGKAAFTIQGPPSRRANCKCSFSYPDSGKTVVVGKQLPPLALPVDGAAWHHYFDTYVRSEKCFQEAYDLANSCELRFSAEELGQYDFTCAREFSPLRWIVRWENRSYVVRLKDDTGNKNGLQLSRFEFASPDLSVPLDATTQDQLVRVPEAGGLYCARSSDACHSIVVPPVVIHSLSDLGVKPVLLERPRTAQSIAEIVSLYEIWSHARTSGDPLSSRRRSDVLEALMKAIVERTCGGEWLATELKGSKNHGALAELKSAISRKSFRAGFGAALWLKHAELAQQSLGRRVTIFSQLAKSHLELPGFASLTSQSKDLYEWTAEFTLRLFTRPETLIQWAPSQLASGLGYVLECPTLARGGRFLALAIAFTAPSAKARLTNLPNWDWP